MRNEFSQRTRRLFDKGGYMVSSESGRNWADCLHHILGRVSDSPYNAAPLNNSYEHLPEGRVGLPALSSANVISKYLIKTKNYLDSIKYIPTKEDIAFMETNKKYYEVSSKSRPENDFPF
jgi:hypothetical protein